MPSPWIDAGLLAVGLLLGRWLTLFRIRRRISPHCAQCSAFLYDFDYRSPRECWRGN